MKRAIIPTEKKTEKKSQTTDDELERLKSQTTDDELERLKSQTTTQQLEFLLRFLFSLGIFDLPIWEIFSFLNIQDFFLTHEGSIFPRELKIKCFRPGCNNKAILPNLACRNCLECDRCGLIFGPFTHPSSKLKDGKFICSKCDKEKIFFISKKLIEAIRKGKGPQILELSIMKCNSYCNSQCVIEGKFLKCPVPYARHYCTSNNPYGCRCKALKPCKYHFLYKGCNREIECRYLHKCYLCDIGVHKSICPYKEPL